MHDNEVVEKTVLTPSEPVESVSSEPVRVTSAKVEDKAAAKRVKAVNSATSKDPQIAGSYRTVENLNMRHGAGMSEKVMTIIPKNTKVRNFGFYTEVKDAKWLYVQVILNNVMYSGFCSSKYLDKI